MAELYRIQDADGRGPWRPGFSAQCRRHRGLRLSRRSIWRTIPSLIQTGLTHARADSDGYRDAETRPDHPKARARIPLSAPARPNPDGPG